MYLFVRIGSGSGSSRSSNTTTAIQPRSQRHRIRHMYWWWCFLQKKANYLTRKLTATANNIQSDSSIPRIQSTINKHHTEQHQNRTKLNWTERKTFQRFWGRRKENLKRKSGLVSIELTQKVLCFFLSCVFVAYWWGILCCEHEQYTSKWCVCDVLQVMKPCICLCNRILYCSLH